MTSPQIFVSRYHVEFGPFAPHEVIALHERRVFVPTDFARESGSDRWIPMNEWRRGWTLRHRGPRLRQKNTPVWTPPSRRAPRRPAAKNHAGGSTNTDY